MKERISNSFLAVGQINLLFKGNIVQDVRERQRFLMHFIALSRHQGSAFSTYCLWMLKG
ncbi:MAG: hypothetical protein MRERV_18c019 [Mycoplasmataceae bacterium RV_VA103A]|nr:MAG: hypothetical protein MRERV_18c019 [Mycoplasmataceae bacterium RV_VA103A]